MYVNGCHIVSKINAESSEGFSSTVSRNRVGSGPAASEASTAQPAVTEILRGPFMTIKEAIDYAQLWNDAANPPPFPQASSVEASKSEPAATPVTESSPENVKSAH